MSNQNRSQLMVGQSMKKSKLSNSPESCTIESSLMLSEYSGYEAQGKRNEQSEK